MPRYAKRVDANHGEIRDEFRKLLGDSNVFDCYAFGNGFPDLVVQFGGVTMLCEVKTAKGRLTEAQKGFPLMMRLVRNVADVAETVSVLKRWHESICKGAV